VFQGHGVLEWSVKARYVGEFFNGLYHGEGTFEWPDKAHVYRGQWQFGEMSGKGTLTTGCGSIYSGEFHAGNMEGRGTITFITNDQYVGEFKDSNFNGLGCYTWSSGTSLVGVFENNFCDKVGKKTYPSGQVYMGELSEDQEHGRGVLSDQHGARIVGVWNMGRLEEELVETIVPANEVDASNAVEREHRVFVSARPVDGGVAPAQDLTTAVGGEEGRSLVVFTNGDKYIGGLKNGMKQGTGMYVYADGSAYKGTWECDAMDGVAHPSAPLDESEETQRLHEMNQRTLEATNTLRTKLLSDKKQVPPVYKLQDS
jgi:hypothetical protein